MIGDGVQQGVVVDGGVVRRGDDDFQDVPTAK